MERFRGLFPVVDRMLYLNHASETPVPTPVRQRIEEYMDVAAGDPDAAFIDLQPLKERLARLLGGSPAEYAVMPNTSTAINAVALGLDWRPGDNVVVPAQEFPANLYPWLNLRERGVEVRIVPLERNLRVDPARVAERVDGRTRVLAVSAVEYLSGFRNDLPRLSEMARARGALFVVDGIQAAGAMPLDVEADGIDVLAAGGYKWLIGPIGTGFLYIRRSVWERVRPVLPGAFSSIQGAEDPDGLFTFRPDAGRYESGCMPFSLLHGWTAGLDMLLEAGIDNVSAQIRLLTDRLIAGLQVRGIAIASPVGRKSERSGILSFTLGSPEANEALVK
ncbi:MAG: aminotransferase class V-fold PLP-dependent enzyme, partial [Bacillota bacterium]